MAALKTPPQGSPLAPIGEADGEAARSAGGADAPGNPALLKHDIDRGRTGDKTAGFDPAMSPLGTDDEAGGAPPSRAEVELARAVETRRPDDRKVNAQSDVAPPDGEVHYPLDLGRMGGKLLIAALLLVIAAIAWLILSQG